MSFERIPFPQGNSPQQLYQNQVSVVRELKRIFQDITAGEETDLSEIVSDITQLRTDVDALMADLSDGGLTLQQQFMLSLTTASSDILGSIANVYERVRTRWEHDADSAIQAAIEAHKANTGLRTEIRVRQEETLPIPVNRRPCGDRGCGAASIFSRAWRIVRRVKRRYVTTSWLCARGCGKRIFGAWNGSAWQLAGRNC